MQAHQLVPRHAATTDHFKIQERPAATHRLMSTKTSDLCGPPPHHVDTHARAEARKGGYFFEAAPLSGVLGSLTVPSAGLRGAKGGMRPTTRGIPVKPQRRNMYHGTRRKREHHRSPAKKKCGGVRPRLQPRFRVAVNQNLEKILRRGFLKRPKEAGAGQKSNYTLAPTWVFLLHSLKNC